jgi:hypothetical protein
VSVATPRVVIHNHEQNLTCGVNGQWRRTWNKERTSANGRAQIRSVTGGDIVATP